MFFVWKWSCALSSANPTAEGPRMHADRGVLADSWWHGAYFRLQLHPHTLRQAQPERPGTGGVCRVGKPTPDMSPVTFRRSISLSIHITYTASLCSSVGGLDSLLVLWVVIIVATDLFFCFGAICLGQFRPRDPFISISIYSWLQHFLGITLFTSDFMISK